VTSLVRHSLKEHADRSFYCGDCGSDFQSKLELVRHKRLFCEKISQKLRQKRVAEEIKRMTGKSRNFMISLSRKDYPVNLTKRFIPIHVIYFRCQRDKTP